MAITPDRRVTESGIEVKPVYGQGDATGAADTPGSFPFTRGPYATVAVPRPPVDDAPVRGLPGLPRNECEVPHVAPPRADGAFRRVRSLPTQLGYDSDDAVAEGEGSAGRESQSTRSRTWNASCAASLSQRVSTSMTINAPAALLLLCYELVAAEQKDQR